MNTKDNELNQAIRLSEQNYLGSLFNYCEQLFRNHPLPSHDQYHHYRVWQYAKDLLINLANKRHIKFIQEYIQGLLIASFFHDTGMKYTHDKKHGMMSRKLCSEYFGKKSPDKPGNLNEILEAIEHHDDKEYQSENHSGNTTHPSLLSILSVADDLDALGVTGVVRYAEIYLLRGIKLENLAQKVIANAENRFRNFMEFCHDLPSLKLKHNERFKTLIHFYEDLPENNVHLKILSNIQNNLRYQKTYSLEKLIVPAESEITPFKEALKNELENSELLSTNL